MKAFHTLRSHLGWKLFISYLVVVLVGTVVLTIAVNSVAPAAFDRHMGQMMSMGMGMGMGRRAMDNMMVDLYANFRAALREALEQAALAAILTAVLISIFVSRRIVGPIQQMMLASRHIASGHYNERVTVPGDDELSELARYFNRMAEVLEQTERRRLELIGDVTHELRTPLTAIQGYMEGLMDGVLPSEPATYQLIHHEVTRLQRLVRDLQELSRVESGQIALNRQLVNVHALIQGAVERLRPQFEDKGVVLKLETSENLPPVLIDPDRITQVLLNLIGNALQYTPPNGQVTVQALVTKPTARRSLSGGRPSVAETSGSQPMITIQVTDTGIGIPPEHLPHIFERFYRVDKSRSRTSGGSGIGLTIARHLVEAHGGRIWARSPGPDQGSTFAFTLPIASSSQA